MSYPTVPVQTRRSRLSLRRMVLIGFLVITTAISWSYVQALNRPGTDPVGIRSVEWLKDHHLSWFVNQVERTWYQHHQPKKGGAPSGPLAATLNQAPAPAPPPSSPPVTTRSHLPAPPPIAPAATGLFAHEGEWRPLGQSVGGLPAMRVAFVPPDAVHTSLITAVAWMDPTLARFVGYAGVQEPGGGPFRHQAPIPDAVRPDLVAAFNSGFKMRDAQGGYYSDGRAVRPLRDGAATLVIRTDGTPTVGQWGRDLSLDNTVAFARQNLSLIVDGGQPVAGLGTDSSRWGKTLGNQILVWRSGVGVTADGALVYVAGEGLSAGSLADVLTRAGAVRAMELDINSQWVDFFSYTPAPAGQAPSAVTPAKLLDRMHPPLDYYLQASSRDFIAVFAKN